LPDVAKYCQILRQDKSVILFVMKVVFKKLIAGFVVFVFSFVLYQKFTGYKITSTENTSNVAGVSTGFLDSLPKDFIVYPDSSLVSQNKTLQGYDLLFESNDPIEKIASYYISQSKKLGYTIEKPLVYKKENITLSVMLTNGGAGLPVIIEVIYEKGD